MNPTEIWKATLAELELQMTKATFDTWVRPTFAVEYDAGLITVGVHSSYAKEWLEARLHTAIQRTLTGIVGQSVQVQYVVKDKHAAPAPIVQQVPPASTPEQSQTAQVANEPEPEHVDVTLIQLPTKPFVMIPKYAIWFWQPLMGHTAFSTYILLRSVGREYEGWGKTQRVSVDILADTLAVGRQTITGRKREQGWLEGCFDVLNRFKVAKIVTAGKGRDLVYDARVLHELPMLSPHQFELLPDRLQERHVRFLKEFEIDYERWEQLRLDSLIPD